VCGLDKKDKNLPFILVLLDIKIFRYFEIS
jgi:hypothetical protein